MNAGEKNQKVSSSITETSTLSYMLRVNYNYDNRYMLTLTGRTDGYSAFGTNNKYAFSLLQLLHGISVLKSLWKA